MEESDIMIKINNLSFKYCDELILKDLSYTFEEGNLYSVIGLNGSGKTTLLNCIARRFPDYKGIIEVDNKLLFIDDHPILIEHLTIREYIELIENYSNNSNKIEVEQAIIDLLLEEHLEKDIIECSLGTRQKVALLTSIALDYKIILMDEPFRSLDVISTNVISKVLKKLAGKGYLIILTSNILEYSYEISDNLLFLSNGKFIDIDTTKSYTEIKESIKELI